MVTYCSALRDSSYFQGFVIGVIVIAGIVVGLETDHELLMAHTDTFHLIDTIILWIFTIEIVIKLIAEGKTPWVFFKDPWNVFDFIVVVVCFMPFNAEYVAVLRLIRILRVLRIITAIPKLQVLVGALLKSIPSMVYVSLLLFLLFYIYAVVGCFLFAGNDPFHFGSLGDSLLSLFRIVTLEDWTDVMYIQVYGSDAYPTPNPAGIPIPNPQAFPVIGIVYFVSFVLIGTMIMLNLFIGIIMTGMDETRLEEEINEKALQRSKQQLSLSEEIDHVHDELEVLQKHLLVLQKRIRDESSSSET